MGSTASSCSATGSGSCFPTYPGSERFAVYRRVAVTGEPCRTDDVYHEQAWAGTPLATRVVDSIIASMGENLVVSARDVTERRRTEEELRLRAELLDLAHDAVIVRDPAESRVTFWNREAHAIYGYSPAEALGQVTHELLATVFPESREAVDDALAREGQWVGELRHTRKDGTVIVVSSRQALQRGADGRPSAIIELNSDITERKLVEVELRRLAAGVDSSADAILSKDRDCRITSWNRGAERLYGYTASEIVGQHVSVLVPADRAGEEQAILDRVLRGEDVGRYETQRLAKDGTVIDVSITVSPIRGASGDVIGASSIHRDITEQKRAEEELRLRAELLDLAHDAVIVRDPAESRVTFWNREAQAIYGYSPEEALGRVTHELLATVFPESREAVDDALAREGRWVGELRHTRKDGTVIVVSSRQALQRGADGRPSAIIELNSDITERKRVEEELAHIAGLLGAHRGDQQDGRLGVRRRDRRADVDRRGVPHLRRRADVRSDGGHAGDRGLRSRERADHRCGVQAAGGRGRALRSRARADPRRWAAGLGAHDRPAGDRRRPRCARRRQHQ